jgi:hypothetical protein
MMNEPFYVHSVEVWGRPNKWGVFERLPRGWRLAHQRTWETRGPAEALAARMNADWRRYQAAMWDKRRTA